MITVHQIPEAFSAAECDRITQIANAAVPSDAKLVRDQKDHNYRRAELVWLDEVSDSEWVMDRILQLVRVANRDVFDFEVSEFAESAHSPHTAPAPADISIGTLTSAKAASPAAVNSPWWSNSPKPMPTKAASSSS